MPALSSHCLQIIAGEVCFWLVRLLAQDTATLLEWPVFREVIQKSAGAQRLGDDPSQLEAKLKQWVAEITSKIKVEVGDGFEKCCIDLMVHW